MAKESSSQCLHFVPPPPSFSNRNVFSRPSALYSGLDRGLDRGLARGRQARVAGLALLARPLVVLVVVTPRVRARLVDAAEDLAFGRARVRGLAAWNAGPKEI